MDILQLIFDNPWKVVLLILSIGMVVYDLAKGVYTTDGERWETLRVFSSNCDDFVEKETKKLKK